MTGIAAIINADHAPLDDALLRGVMGVSTSQRESNAQVRVFGGIGLGSVPLAHRADTESITCLDGVWAVMSGRLDDRSGLLSALDLGAGGDVSCLSDVALLLRAYRSGKTTAFCTCSATLPSVSGMLAESVCSARAITLA